MDHKSDYIIVLGHGSRVRKANQSLERLAQEVSRLTGIPAGCAFLELAAPDLAQAVSSTPAAGSRRIIVIPCFVAMGTHVRRDLPRVIAQVQASAPRLQIVLGQPLDGHPGLAAMVADRVREAAAQVPAGVSSQASPASRRRATAKE